MSDTLDAPNHLHAPMFYQIKLKGHLGCDWADWFGGMTVTSTEDGDTLLTGLVMDQAALHGLLRKVRDLGIPLVSLQCVGPNQIDASVVDQ